MLSVLEKERQDLFNENISLTEKTHTMVRYMCHFISVQSAGPTVIDFNCRAMMYLYRVSLYLFLCVLGQCLLLSWGDQSQNTFDAVRLHLHEAHVCVRC